MACIAIIGLTLDKQSRDELERIGKKAEYVAVLGALLTAGKLYQILAKRNVPYDPFDLSEVDWKTYAIAMNSLSVIQRVSMRKDFEQMALRYQLQAPYDYKHLQFWQQLADGCNDT